MIVQRQINLVHPHAGGHAGACIGDRPTHVKWTACPGVDRGSDGNARIFDYKTGRVPSGNQVRLGLAPQLTLEAAMLKRGAFPGIGAADAVEHAYVKLGAGDPPVDVKPVKLDATVAATADEHLAGLQQLLASYADPAFPYLPRVLAEKEDDALAYDHLSRFREWALSGGRT